MTELKKYDLEPLESDYRKLTAQNDLAAVSRLKSMLQSIRYDLRMDFEVQMEYRDGMDTPMVMRILRNERDLDRWIAQRFMRLEEFKD